ncbi:hypothetical protein LINPERHAP2_LOCUS9554 [Linum perenne]
MRSTEIGIMCWYLWKARNDSIFNNCNEPPESLALRIKGWSITIKDALNEVEVQVDSRVAISLIFGAENVHHQHASKVSSIRALLRRDYEVTISHVYREGNYATDYLADIGHGFPPRDSLD